MGVQLLARVNAADHWDDFNTSGSIPGRVMGKGGLAWGRDLASGSTTVPGVTGGTLRATGTGSGNAIAVVNPGTTKYTLVTKIAAMAANPIPAIIWRALDANNHYQLALRVTSSGAEYAIFRRFDGTLGSAIVATGVTPKVGDRIRVEVDDIRCVVYVNGAQIGSTTMASFAGAPHCGVNVNAIDITTAFDDFGIYV
ncbi:hypothetical protein [Microbacterium gubbeenense]|uniref:hypothetical protein n=1 Tax=Microbacterium gubbeenense TaxID=159896 RepID=UPI003F9AC5EF